jgi:glycopeptide antibiotics resistance protein
VLIELAQYVFRLDRVSSVDDVLINAAGAGLAALASRPWWRGTFRGHIENRIRTGNTTSS